MAKSLILTLQDTAAEHPEMPYRALELLDVKAGSVIDTKVGIWSLGLYRTIDLPIVFIALVAGVSSSVVRCKTLIVLKDMYNLIPIQQSHRQS